MRGRVDGHEGADARPGATRCHPSRRCVGLGVGASRSRCAPVGPLCFRRPPACVSGWHWGVGPAYRNVHEKRKKRLTESCSRSPCVRPSRHPCTVRPCTPASLLQRTCARRVALTQRASAPVRWSRRRRAARTPVVSPTRSVRLWGLQEKCSAPKRKEKSTHLSQRYGGWVGEAGLGHAKFKSERQSTKKQSQIDYIMQVTCKVLGQMSRNLE